jgi:formate dehydrogenase subunit gamma
VYCLGLCALSPAVMVDGRPHARMTTAKLEQLAEQMELAP